MVATIVCTGIVANPTVVSHYFSAFKSFLSFNNCLHWDCWKSNRCFILFFPLTNLGTVSSIFSTAIVGNPTVVSNFFSFYKSSHSLNNSFHCDCWKSNCCVNFFPLSNLAIVSTIFCTGTVENTSVVSNFIPLTNLAIVSKIFALGLLEIQSLFQTFHPVPNLPIGSTILQTGIVGNETVVSNLFPLTDLAIVSKMFALELLVIQPLFETFFLSQIYP